MHGRANRSFFTLLGKAGMHIGDPRFPVECLVLISAADGMLRLRSHVVSRPMGIAIDARRGRRRIGISTRGRALVFAEAPRVVADFATPGRSRSRRTVPPERPPRRPRRVAYVTGLAQGTRRRGGSPPR